MLRMFGFSLFRPKGHSSTGYNDVRSLSDYVNADVYDQIGDDSLPVPDRSSDTVREHDFVNEGAADYRHGVPPNPPRPRNPCINDQIRPMSIVEEQIFVLDNEHYEYVGGDCTSAAATSTTQPAHQLIQPTTRPSGVSNNNGRCDSTANETGSRYMFREAELWYQPLNSSTRQIPILGNGTSDSSFVKQTEVKKRIEFEVHVDYKKMAKVTAVIIDATLSSSVTAHPTSKRAEANFENFKSTALMIYESRGDITVSVKDVQWARDVNAKSLEKRIVPLDSLLNGIDCPTQFSQECKPGRLQSGRLKVDVCVEQRNTAATTLSVWCDLSKIHEFQKKSSYRSSSVATRNNTILLHRPQDIYAPFLETYFAAAALPSATSVPLSQQRITESLYNEFNPLIDNNYMSSPQYTCTTAVGRQQPHQAVPGAAAPGAATPGAAADAPVPPPVYIDVRG